MNAGFAAGLTALGSTVSAGMRAKAAGDQRSAKKVVPDESAAETARLRRMAAAASGDGEAVMAVPIATVPVAESASYGTEGVPMGMVATSPGRADLLAALQRWQGQDPSELGMR